MLLRRNKTGGYKMRVTLVYEPKCERLTFEWGLDTSNAKEAYARARILLRILVAAGLSRHNKIHVRDADNDALYNQEYVSAENIEWTRRKRKKRKEMGKKKEYRYKDVPFIKGLEPKKTDEKQG